MKQNETFGRYCLLLCIDGAFLCVSLCVKRKIWFLNFFAIAFFFYEEFNGEEKNRNNSTERLFYVYSFFVWFLLISVRQAIVIEMGFAWTFHFIGHLLFAIFLLNFEFSLLLLQRYILFIICCWCVFCFFLLFCSSAQDFFFHDSFFHACLAFFIVENVFVAFVLELWFLKCESHLAIFRIIFLLCCFCWSFCVDLAVFFLCKQINMRFYKWKMAINGWK